MHAVNNIMGNLVDKGICTSVKSLNLSVFGERWGKSIKDICSNIIGTWAWIGCGGCGRGCGRSGRF